MSDSTSLSLANPHDQGLAPSRLPRALQWAGLVLFLVGTATATGFAITEHWRRATFVLGISMLFLAVLRLSCDSRVLGVFAVRSRCFDAVFCALVGGTMAFLAASVDALGS